MTGALGVGAVRLLIVAAPLILLPILLGRWGMDVYGAWITANALAGFLGAVSVSILPVMTAETARRVAANDLVGAATAFRTWAVVACGMSILLTGGATLIYVQLAHNRVYDLAPLDVYTIVLLFAATGIAGLASVYSYALGAVGAFGLGNGMEAARRAAELGFTIIAVLAFGASPFAVAGFMAVAAVVFLILTRRSMKIRAAWKPEQCAFDAMMLHRDSGKMIGSVLLAATYNQAMVVAPRALIESLLGAREVVQFAAISNLTRGVRQLADILVFPFQPEFSFALGARRMDEARRLFLLSSRFAFWFPLFAIGLLLLIGPTLIWILTDGDVVVDKHLFVVLALATLADCALLPATVWLIATGRTLALAMAFLLVGGVAIAAAAGWAGAVGSVAFAYSTLVTALLAGLWATHVSLRMVGSDWRSLLASARRFPSEAVIGLFDHVSRRSR